VALCGAFAAAPSMETPVLLIGPVVVIGALLILPFAFGEGESFTHLAEYTPWIPAMDA